MERGRDGRHRGVQNRGVERLHEKRHRNQPREQTLARSRGGRGKRRGAGGWNGAHKLCPSTLLGSRLTPVPDALPSPALALFRHCLLESFASLCIAQQTPRRAIERHAFVLNSLGVSSDGFGFGTNCAGRRPSAARGIVGSALRFAPSAGPILAGRRVATAPSI